VRKQGYLSARRALQQGIHLVHHHQRHSMCVCVRERETERGGERERERVSVCGREKERGRGSKATCPPDQRCSRASISSIITSVIPTCSSRTTPKLTCWVRGTNLSTLEEKSPQLYQLVNQNGLKVTGDTNLSARRALQECIHLVDHYQRHPNGLFLS